MMPQVDAPGRHRCCVAMRRIHLHPVAARRDVVHLYRVGVAYPGRPRRRALLLGPEVVRRFEHHGDVVLSLLRNLLPAGASCNVVVTGATSAVNWSFTFTMSGGHRGQGQDHPLSPAADRDIRFATEQLFAVNRRLQPITSVGQQSDNRSASVSRNPARIPAPHALGAETLTSPLQPWWNIGHRHDHRKIRLPHQRQVGVDCLSRVSAQSSPPRRSRWRLGNRPAHSA